MKKFVKVIFWVIGILLLFILLWWWQWQAPYRTLKSFLNALEQCDTDTLYSLAPPKERKFKIVTRELIYYTCQKLVHPLLFKQYRLVAIKRDSPDGSGAEIWIRDVAVVFYLYYHNKYNNKEIKPPLVVFVLQPPHSKQWYISFSYFTYTTAHSLIGFDETQGNAWMYNAGYRYIYLPNGAVERLKKPAQER